MPKRDDAEDRRRSPRFSCAGYAEIARLPSNGILVPGKIRDLGVGGCCVDTTLPIHRGERAEIVVRVNAASFRVVGEVKAVRGGSEACIEFVRLSARGKDLLGDLVRELARLQAVMNKLTSARRDMDPKMFRRELEEGRLEAAALSKRFPLFWAILPAQNSGESSEPNPSAPAGKDQVVEEQPLVIPVDLFG